MNVKRLISSIEINYSFDEQIKICYFINKSIFLSQKTEEEKRTIYFTGGCSFDK